MILAVVMTIIHGIARALQPGNDKRETDGSTDPAC